MTHPRKSIRDALQAMLLNQTDAQDRVWTNRAKPVSQRPSQRSSSEQVPAILIYTGSESSQILNVAPREYLRTVEVVIELAMGVPEDEAEIDTALDAFARAVEAIVLEDDTVDGTASDFRMTGSSMGLLDIGEVPIGVVRMTFEADYVDAFPMEGQPANLDDLRTVPTAVSLGGEQATADRKSDTVRLDMALVRARVLTDGVTVELTMPEDIVTEVDEVPVDLTAGFTIKVDGSPVAISAGSASGAVLGLTVPTIYGGQSVTATYNPTTGGIVGEDFELVAFTDRAVANFSEQAVPVIGCAFPLDADAAEVLSSGASGKLTMSGGDQTGAYVLQTGLGSDEQFAALPANTMTMAGQSFDVSSGIVGIRLNLDQIPLRVSASGGYDAGLGVYAKNFSQQAYIGVRSEDDGTCSVMVFGTGGSVAPIPLATPPGWIGVYFVAATGQWGYVLDGVDGGLVGTFNPAIERVPLLIVTEGTGLDAVYAGDVVQLTLESAAGSMGAGWPATTTDPCGNAIN